MKKIRKKVRKPSDRLSARQVKSVPADFLDIDKLIGSEKEACASHYGIIFMLGIENFEAPVAVQNILRIFRDVMFLKVSIHPRRQAFESSCLPVNGPRSTDGADFYYNYIDLLSDYSERVSHPVVKARLAHLVSFLDPSRKKIGIIALNSYMRIISLLEQNEYSATGYYRNSNFVIVELMYSTSKILDKFNYPNRDSIKFTSSIRKFIQKFDAEGDVFSFFRLIELMIYCSKLDIYVVKNILEKFARKRNHLVKFHHKAHAWRLLAKAYGSAGMDDEKIVYAKKAVDIYIRLFDRCIRSRRPVEAQVWLDTAIHCYKECGDRRYADLYERKRGNERSILRELASAYSQDSKRSDEFAVEVDVSSITLSEALYEFTTLARSPDPKIVLKQAKAVTQSCPTFGRLSLPIWESVDGIQKMSYSSDFRTQGQGQKYDRQVHFIEEVRRLILVRDSINFYRSVVGNERRVSKYDIMEIIEHSPVVDPCFVDTVSDGFDRYFKGDMTSAFYILTPLLEGIIRRALIITGHDATTYHNPVGIQADRTISSMFESMREDIESIFGPATVADIERVFLSEGGPRLRHGYAHANLSDLAPGSNDSIYGLWLIWRLIALPLIPRWSEVASK